MHQFKVKSEDLSKEIFEMTGDEAQHLICVLRLKKNDFVSLFDGMGKKVIATIIAINRDSVKLKIIETRVLDAEPMVEITLYQSIPKKDKFEWIIQKATELGAKQIVPIITERTIVNITNENVAKKLLRWQKIAQEASKQSNRACIPLVSEPMPFNKILNNLNHDLVLFLWNSEQSEKIKTVLDKFNGAKLKSVGVFIGPEGGWSPSEIEIAKTKNIISVSLGPRILRTETASLTVLTILLYEFGDIGG